MCSVHLELNRKRYTVESSNQPVRHHKAPLTADVKFILDAKKPCECGSEARRIDCCHKVNSVGDSLKVATLKMFDALGRVANHMALLYPSSYDNQSMQDLNRRLYEFCTGHPFSEGQNVVEATKDPDNCGKWTLLEGMLLEWRSKPEENNRVLIFSKSVRLLKLLKDFILFSDELGGFDVDLFSGEVGKEERMQMVDRFQDPNSHNFILLVSVMAGGVGLNLTAVGFGSGRANRRRIKSSSLILTGVSEGLNRH